jgi:CubicO group peptidase (beta-lactamase class C family)
MQHTHSAWSFSHIRELMPTAPILGSSEPRRFEYDVGRQPKIENRVKAKLGLSLHDLIEKTGTDGLIVLHGGRISGEWYNNGFSACLNHLTFSVSKAITGICAGALIATKTLDESKPVEAYIPELANSAFGGRTIRDLLDMRVGIDFEENYLDPKGDVALYWRSNGWTLPDRPGFERSQRDFLVSIAAGGGGYSGAFKYASPNTDVLAWVFERACGLSFNLLVERHVWQPMGASREASITLDRAGAPRASGGISASLHDLARLGELVRNGGRYHDTQVVPAQWIDDLIEGGSAEAWVSGNMAQYIPDGRYRSGWYAPFRDRPVVVALGVFGQCIFVDPGNACVAVRVASQGAAVGEDFGSFEIWETLASA